MSGSVAVVGALAGLAGVGATTALVTGAVRRERVHLPRAHACRVDLRRDPLGVALRYGCAGLTLGVRVDPRGRLLLAGAEDPGRTLRRFVLDPLATRVGADKRVYPAQGAAFSVVIEAADGVEPMYVLDVLDDELADYVPMLTGCVAGTVQAGAVVVLVRGVPHRVLEGRANRLFFGEGTLSDVERGVSTSAVPMAGEHIAWRFGWDGRDQMPAEERYLLRALVRAAHAERKRVRFHGVPESRRSTRLAFWRELQAAGVDLISARDLGALHRFLRGRGAHR